MEFQDITPENGKWYISRRLIIEGGPGPDYEKMTKHNLSVYKTIYAGPFATKDEADSRSKDFTDPYVWCCHSE